ncbi:MAG TPA: sigma factor [Microthrixaceae bacterium]|nr:sigma factor [Microthrixaceae bacterium]
MTAPTVVVDPQVLALEHLHLVDEVAASAGMRRLLSARFSIDDARQEGWFGLVAAARRFDPDRGAFVPWARWSVRAAIRAGAARVAGADGRRRLRYEAVRPGLVHATVSLDATAFHDDDAAVTVADRVPAAADTAVEAIARCELTAAVAAGYDHAYRTFDPLARVVLAQILAVDARPSDRTVAARFGIHPARVARCRARLIAAMRAAAPTIAAPGN